MGKKIFEKNLVERNKEQKDKIDISQINSPIRVSSQNMVSPYKK